MAVPLLSEKSLRRRIVALRRVEQQIVAASGKTVRPGRAYSQPLYGQAVRGEV